MIFDLVRPDDAVQYIVLAFIGCISVTSMRGFLRNMRKVCCSVTCHLLPLGIALQYLYFWLSLRF